MPYFTYKARDAQGKLISGTLESDSRSSVVARLQVMGYFPVDIRGGEATSTGARPAASRWLGRIPFGRGRVRSGDLTMFYRQMSDLVGAGVPLVKALGIVKEQSPSPALRGLLSQVDQDVQSGDTFARALARHPGTFNRLATAMIHAGEAGGLLEETLGRLADFAEMEEELRGRVKSALAYPLIMSAAGLLAVIVLITFVIPRIVSIFRDLNQTLPVTTQLLIAVSEFLGAYWYLLAGGLALALGGARRYVRSSAGALHYARLQLKLPVLGEVILKRDVARFARTLGSLLKNGVPILSALEIANEVLTNALIRADTEKIPDGITQGVGVARSLKGSAFFPPVVVNMIAIGEETGNLPGVLLKVASTYEGQVDRSIKTLTSILEPLIILIMGLVVGFIVISMLLPIFSLDPTGA